MVAGKQHMTSGTAMKRHSDARLKKLFSKKNTHSYQIFIRSFSGKNILSVAEPSLVLSPMKIKYCR